mgnify:CR=1 FL=1
MFQKTIAIVDVPNRKDTRLARAPQSFYLDEIIALHRQAIAEGKEDFIDSCSMMQYYGRKLYLIDGPQENIKITTPDDFYTMRALLDAKEEAQIFWFRNQKINKLEEKEMQSVLTEDFEILSQSNLAFEQFRDKKDFDHRGNRTDRLFTC